MRSVTSWGFFKASQTVTARGSVRRRMGPERMSGRSAKRSAKGVQGIIWTFLHERIKKACLRHNSSVSNDTTSCIKEKIGSSLEFPFLERQGLSGYGSLGQLGQLGQWSCL